VLVPLVVSVVASKESSMVLPPKKREATSFSFSSQCFALM
jgi:hypothetical protein